MDWKSIRSVMYCGAQKWAREAEMSSTSLSLVAILVWPLHSLGINYSGSEVNYGRDELEFFRIEDICNATGRFYSVSCGFQFLFSIKVMPSLNGRTTS
jgi:hypothetical protein